MWGGRPRGSTIEYMFEERPPRPETLPGLSDSALVSAIADWARAAAAAEAAKSAAIAELVRRRCIDEHPDWACDDWDSCAAELSCVLAVSHRTASGAMRLAITLRDRLPNVAALFLDGQVSARSVGTIAWRTDLVVDPAALAAVDADMATAATRWGRLSQEKLERAVDAAVARRDPAAVHRAHARIKARDFIIGDADDTTGITSVWGRLATPDAALLAEAVTALAKSVCPEDPRTLAQRRADALGALAARAANLRCLCGGPGCAAGGDDPVAARFVVHILAEADALDAAPDPDLHGGPDLDAPEPTKTASVSTRIRIPDKTPPPSPARRTAHGIGVIPGAPGTGLVGAAQIADLITRGARVRPLRPPGDEPEHGYRPSAALARWIRLRDATCRHPGCDAPADRADIDHTIPWPCGPTHPSNTKSYCRKHHLVKTFWPGWSDRQDPDGRLHVTTPSGVTYTTKPTAALLFPDWNTTTASLPPPPPRQLPAPERGLRMPRRQRTRAQVRSRRIAEDRNRNDTPDAGPPGWR